MPLALGVLQILALDIATDLLPALALGAEPGSSRVLDGPPLRRRLIDRSILRRVFGLLGPVEAAVSMGAFLAVLVSAGWSYGEPVPATLLAAASGAAFTAVVLGQFANAFACRSTTRPPWRLRGRSNPLLLWAIGIELLVLVAMLLVPPVAGLLGHRPPPSAGLLLAACAVPAVLGADALDKAVRRRLRRDQGPPATGPRPLPCPGPSTEARHQQSPAAVPEEEPCAPPTWTAPPHAP